MLSKNGNGKLPKNGTLPPPSSINIIGEGTTIRGEVNCSGDMRIDGKVKGLITSNSKIVVGPKGVVDGDVSCKNADISGSVMGCLDVDDLLFLKGNSTIEGDIVSSKLVVEAGATFNGTCKMGGTKDIKDEKTIATEVKKEVL